MATKTILVNLTYETWDEAAVQAGETDDAGFIFEDRKVDAEALHDIIREYGFTEEGGSTWLTTVDPENDYQSGESTYYALHVSHNNENLTEATKFFWRVYDFTRKLT